MSPMRTDILPATVELAVLIRFKDSAATLPAVLAALQAQTRRPELIVAIDSGSTDDSPRLLAAAGAEIHRWSAPYHHAKVLNFGLARCPARHVLVLSSHTVLHDPDTLERMLAAMRMPGSACVSGKWSAHDSWSDAIDLAELRASGLRFCSIYSNSFGMLARALWEAAPFDEHLVTMEDYAWALDQVSRGRICRRLEFRFSYQRASRARDYAFAAVTFHLAQRHRLRVGWLGVRATLRILLSQCLRFHRPTLQLHAGRLLASLTGRFWLPQAESRADS